MTTGAAGLELLVVGAGPAYTDRPGATGAAYLVGHGDDAIVLDLGQGSFPRLAEAVEPSTLLAILISHLHPDHFVDLVPLRHYLRWQLASPGRVRVLAPAGLGERLDGLLGEPGFAAATLDIERLSSGPASIGPFAVTVGRVAHTNESYAMRVAIGDGPGLVYSGDCGRAEDLDPLMRPGDVLLVEVSFGADRVPTDAAHLAAADVGDLARRTLPREVLLTHILMGHDRDATIAVVQSAFDGPVRFVDPGDRVEIAAG